MFDPVIFYMDESFRQQLISNHKFYVDQAKKRLLSQFGDISEEANEYTKKLLSERYFDPDRHDPGDFCENAEDKGFIFWELLHDMHKQTRLSVIAGMYHEWDKQLRDWISNEIWKSFSGKNTKAGIWKADFKEIFDLLESIDWQVRKQSYFSQLDACRLVVNVYKHGFGNSMNDLLKKYPQFIEKFFEGEKDLDARRQYLHYTHLKVTDEDIAAFSKAIIEFWNDVPERICQSSNTRSPTWLIKALVIDLRWTWAKFMASAI